MTEVWQQDWAGDEGEKGSLARLQISAKGLGLAPCKKGTRVGLERKAEETGICYSYS